MSLGNEDKHALDQPAETNNGSQKKLRKSYTRDFLLSLSELEICKKLPIGFDQSVLSEFEDSSQERQRASGSLSLHSLRRHEHGTTPPTRGDVGNYFRSGHGRWDGHPSGRTDRESDSQSDKDSDSGRRHGNQSRRSWPVPEHDGLLGSGSFPRSSGYAEGASAPKLRTSDHCQLNKSNEPYHPPRPYKAVPHSRRDTKDSFNDETFGSSDCTSEDRAEEERKRRASFELLRKEQHKAFQENQMLPDRYKGDFDISELLEDSKDEKRLITKTKESDKISLQLASNHDSARSTLPQQIPGVRPLVPPGFVGTNSEKKIGTKALIQSQSSQVGNSELEANLSSGVLDKHSTLCAEQLILSKQCENPSINISDNNKSEKRKAMKSPSDLDDSCKMVGMVKGLDGNNIPGDKILWEAGPDNSTSILDRLFGSARVLKEGGSSNFNKEPDSEADDISAPDTVQSSKFAHWFLEEGKKPVHGISSGQSNDLLSLIQDSGKDGLEISDAIPSIHALPKFSFQSSEPVHTHVTSNLTSLDSEKPEELCNIKPEEAPAVLTCEDLEKSILLGGSGSPTLSPALPNQNILYVKEQQKAHIDDHATQHLLSLLQRGDGEDRVLSASIDVQSSKLLDDNQVTHLGVAENAPSTGKTLTLETLFGSAFMKELQSVGASTPVLGDLAGSARLDLLDSKVSSIGIADDGFSPALGSNQIASKASLLPFTPKQNTKSDGIEQHLLGLNSQLPEEDTYPGRKPTKGEILSSPDTSVGIAGKLGAINSIFRDERPATGSQGHSPFLHTPYDTRGLDIPLNVQASSSQLRHPQVNQGPLMHHLDFQDASVNSRMNFVAPEVVIQHDPPQRHRFPMNALHPPFPHLSGRLSGFDLPIDHPILQQIHVPGVPPLHMQPGFPGGALVPHTSNQVTGFRQHLNPTQGFPFPHQQPNNGLGIPPGHDAHYENNQPEALQRLIEMELRSSAKEKQPFGAAGHSQGMYSHELEMGFGYR